MFAYIEKKMVVTLPLNMFSGIPVPKNYRVFTFRESHDAKPKICHFPSLTDPWKSENVIILSPRAFCLLDVLSHIGHIFCRTFWLLDVLSHRMFFSVGRLYHRMFVSYRLFLCRTFSLFLFCTRYVAQDILYEFHFFLFLQDALAHPLHPGMTILIKAQRLHFPQSPYNGWTKMSLP